MNFVSACGRLVGVVKSRSSNSTSFSVAEFLEFFEVPWVLVHNCCEKVQVKSVSYGWVSNMAKCL